MNNRFAFAGALLLSGLISGGLPLSATPCYVDLSAVVNTDREDDGVADNKQGGWSDEGINDMGVYPPIPVGLVERNAQKFQLVDPARNHGRAVLMLKGTRRGTDKPEQVSIPMAGIKGKYLYILQNYVGSVSGQPPEYRVATWTVKYADGTSVVIPMRSSIEILDWWCGAWWDNHGAESWPVFMGRNYYSQKYNKFIGVWSTQWKNPSPDKAITDITIQSAGQAAPVVWAITVDDDDYQASGQIKKDFGRPPGIPDGFFTVRLQKEQEAICKAAIAEGRLKGVRSVEVIRPDLLRVIVDSAIGGIGAGSGAGVIEAFQKPETFILSGPGIASQPVRVGRHSYEAWRGDIGAFPANTLFHHAFYLKLSAPLQEGKSYTVRVAGLAAPLTSEFSLVFDPATRSTPVIKVNQETYSSRSPERYAYLGWWAGDLGAVDYGDFKTFEVVKGGDGKVVLQGLLSARAPADPLSGEQVWQLDISALPAGNGYCIRIPGLGCSAPFAVGGNGIHDLYYHTSRAFFHQRCGQELKLPFSDFPRPACHVKAYEGGYLVDNPDYLPRKGETVREFKGGYHDAADDDCFTCHLRSTAQLLFVFEQYPGRFKDKDLNIPESGNGIPDVLDEASWALSFYFDNQRADGAILMGRGNDQDAIRDWERTHKSRPPFGNFPPTNPSCSEYAAVAAQLARVLEPFDSRHARELLKSAVRAYQWARRNPGKPPEQGEALFQVWAASELFRTTGEKQYNADVVSMAASGAFTRVNWNLAHFTPLCKWAYATCQQPGTDVKLRTELCASIKNGADYIVRDTSNSVYRVGHNGKAALGWGNGNGGGYYAEQCLQAYWLTHDPVYLKTASLNADFQLGANPLSKTFITGMGTRPPIQPTINPSLYREPRKTGATVKGITIYGLAQGSPPGFPATVPAYRCWRDLGTGAEACSEFTITETIGPSAMLYATLYAEECGGAK